MEWIDLILRYITPLLAGGTLLTWFLYRKAEKRIKQAEASKSEAEASKSAAEAKLAHANVKIAEIETKDKEREYNDHRFDDLHDTIRTMNSHLKEVVASEVEKDNTITDKTRRIREKDDEIAALNRQLLEKEATIGKLKLFIHWLSMWQCRREHGKPTCIGRNKAKKCDRRLPRQNPPIPFAEYPDRELIQELGVEIEDITDVEVVEESNTKTDTH